MPLTMEQIENIANATLDHYLRGQPMSQTIQDKPLMQALKSGQKTFPGGRGEIRGNVKAEYVTTFMGYDSDDTVVYTNPAKIKQFTFPWRELHAGLSLTLTELKRNGITVANTLNGENTSDTNDRELLEISNIMADKLEDMDEGMARSFNNILWRDGTQSPKVFAGIQSAISLDPTTGVVGGIDRALNPWWRNRALVGGARINPSRANSTLIQTLRREIRQLRRFGGRPTLFLAGSTFIDALEVEITAKGTFTLEGFEKKGATAIGIADISLRGVGSVMYDPTLDDMGMANFAYILDPRRIQLMAMQGEDMKKHSPARPPEKYVLYRGVTFTGTLVFNQLNCHGVYEINPTIA